MVNFLLTQMTLIQADIDALQRLSEVEANKLRPNKYNWIEGNESVPEGWKIRQAEINEETRLSIYAGAYIPQHHL